MRQEIGGARATGKTKQYQDMVVNVHGFKKSNHNLSEAFIGTAAPGVATPVYKRLYTKESTMNMNIQHFVQTTPPEFLPWAAFEMRIRYYAADPRLYIRKLHNNTGKLGRTPEQVYLPGIKVTGPNPSMDSIQPNQEQINPSSLLHHLGYVGLGRRDPSEQPSLGEIQQVERRFGNAIPILMYYDALKNDYCNWQEENAYVLGAATEIQIPNANITGGQATVNYDGIPRALNLLQYIQPGITDAIWPMVESRLWDNEDAVNAIVNSLIINGTGMNKNVIEFVQPDSWPVTATTKWNSFDITPYFNIEEQSESRIRLRAKQQNYYTWQGMGNPFIRLNTAPGISTTGGMSIIPFPLENIDKMREDLLGADMTSPVVIGENGFGDYYPYKLLTDTGRTESNEIFYPNLTTMNGMMLVPYKSDIHHNWMDAEFIDGDNGINALTAVAVVNGRFKLNDLIASNKMFDQLNRIAISKGDWRSYEEMMYGGNSSMYMETPVYIGGASADIYFDEAMAMADSAPQGGEQLGFQGGVGRTSGTRNGSVRFKSKSTFSYVIGIMTIIPKGLTYTQGNDFDVDFSDMTDIHTPTLDGLGFQDKIQEWSAAWDTYVKEDGTVIKHSGGKQLAWQPWMTSYDKAHGLFCNQNDLQGRILSRRFTPDTDTGLIQDSTTYIDPRKFNHIFRYTDLDAQNFQVMIKHNIQGRLNMAAGQVPNL